MKQSFLKVIVIVTLFGCNSQSEHKSETVTETEVVENGEIEEEIEETYQGLQDGYYSVPSEIRTHLNTFCNYDVNSKKGSFEYKSIARNANGVYSKACEYDAVGTYLINTDKEVDESFIASNGFPFLEHSYDDTNLFLIEEINITNKGRKIIMKVRYMPFDPNTGYSVDMDVSTEKVELTVNESDQMVLADRISSDIPRYFIETNQLEKLSNSECDEDYH